MKNIIVVTITITKMLEMIKKSKISLKITVKIITIIRIGGKDSKIIVLIITRIKIATTMIIMKMKMRMVVTTMKM